MTRVIAIALFLSAVAVTGAEALPLETIVISSSHGTHKFQVEVASDPQSQERGLMYRRHLAANAGMIFALPKPETVIFWMKNTYIPLDIVFVREDGTVTSIAADATPLSEKAIPSGEPVLAVIELNGGRTKALGIDAGDVVWAAQFHSAK